MIQHKLLFLIVTLFTSVTMAQTASEQKCFDAVRPIITNKNKVSTVSSDIRGRGSYKYELVWITVNGPLPKGVTNPLKCEFKLDGKLKTDSYSKFLEDTASRKLAEEKKVKKTNESNSKAHSFNTQNK